MSELSVVYDRVKFPMVWVEPVNAFVHWLPVTKIQFECYLCDRPSIEFGEKWYAGILQLNGRISPRGITPLNYWQAFITGILPNEAERFATWSAEGDSEEYYLPSEAQWFEAYKYMRQFPPVGLHALTEGMRERGRTVFEMVEASMVSIQGPSGGRSIADQMLMRKGVMEWVHCNKNPSNPWGAFGQPNKTFHGSFYNLESGQPSFPLGLETRLHAHGMRLFRKGL